MPETGTVFLKKIRELVGRAARRGKGAVIQPADCEPLEGILWWLERYHRGARGVDRDSLNDLIGRYVK